MAAKLKRWKPSLGHAFMRTDPVMVVSPKGGYVDYEEAQAAIARLERKLKRMQTQPDGHTTGREVQHG